MATIEKYETSRGETRYMVRYRKPDHTSTKKRGFTRKKDAQEWLAQHAVIDIRQGTYTDPTLGRTTIGQVRDEWWRQRKPFLRPSTQRTIESSWATHIAPTWAGTPLNRITNNDVQTWVSGLAQRRSPSITREAYRQLRQIIDHAVANNYLPRSPITRVTVPSKPKTKRRRVYLTIGQLVQFADQAACARHNGRERRALILTLGLCGLRWGEAAGLHVDDIDFPGNRITIRRSVSQLGSRHVEGPPKNGASRSIPMPRLVAGALMEVTRGRRDDATVFTDPDGTPIRTQTVSTSKSNRTWWPSALKRCGWPHSRWPSPHDLRHTAASIAIHAGANVKAVQRMLGHANASMTLDVYADLFDVDLDSVAVSIDDAVSRETGERAQNVPKNKKEDR